MDPDAPALPRRKSKPREKIEEDDDGRVIKHKCRFCDMQFDKSQALGGHMNRHRREREAEELDNARMLLLFREQHFGRLLYDMQGGSFPGTLHQGGDIQMPNTPLVGESSRPYFPSNQPSMQNWQLNQLLQNSYSLQSQSQAPGGSFYSSQDSPPPQPQQLRVNPGLGSRLNPGQHQMAQGQQPGADFGSHSQASFHSPLDEVVLGSNPNNVAPPRSNFRYPFVNTRLAPLNETQFQHDQDSYADQKLGSGSSAMVGLEEVVNQVIHGGHHMQPNCEDHLQDDYKVLDAAGGTRPVIQGSEPDGYQDGKDVVDAAATGAAIEGSEP